MFHQIYELTVLGTHSLSPYLRRNRSAPTGVTQPIIACTRMTYMHFVYIVRCADGTLYTGYARDPERRTRVHNAGRGAKYTARRLPVLLVYWERCDSRSAALKREHAVKRLARTQKEALASRLSASIPSPRAHRSVAASR
jgi:putative endonuclease